jgi:hypothetical protein
VTATGGRGRSAVNISVMVEFELLEGASTCADMALIGGVSALRLAIERGVTGTGQTGVKPGTFQAKIPERQII